MRKHNSQQILCAINRYWQACRKQRRLRRHSCDPMLKTFSNPDRSRYMAILSAESRLLRPRWRLVGLLALSVFINYLDRGNLSVAAPGIRARIVCLPDSS